MSQSLLWPGKEMKTFASALIARHTLRIVRHIVALFSCSASPTEYKKPPLAKKRKATQIICTTLSAWLRAVRRLILGPSSLHRYRMPSAENLYLSKRWSSENASGSNRSLKTLSRLKALLSTSASSSCMSRKNGQAIVRAGRNTPFWAFIYIYIYIYIYRLLAHLILRRTALHHHTTQAANGYSVIMMPSSSHHVTYYFKGWIIKLFPLLPLRCFDISGKLHFRIHYVPFL